MPHGLSDQPSLAQAFLEHSMDGMAVVGADGLIVAVNPAFAAITGFDPDAVLGCPCPILEGEGRETEAILEALAFSECWRGEVVRRHADGRPLPLQVSIATEKDETGQPLRRFVVLHEVEAVSLAAEELWRRTNFDALTELPNRNLFLDRLLQALVLAGREETRAALLFIGLDGFKNINDSLGHWVGDKVLQEAARRFQNCLSKGDTAARFGGDEFTMVLGGVRSVDSVETVVRTILEALEEPFVIEQHRVLISCSIGICLWPGDGEDVEALMRNATSALQQAKQAGRNTFRFFTPAMDARAQARSRLADEMAGALENGEFHLVFQPLLDLKSGRVTAAETLLRWHNRYLGAVSPEQFVPLAEELGLLRPIGQWLLSAACAEAARWQALGLGDIGVAVNISPRQFQQADLLEQVEAALRDTGLAPSLLTIEITEGLLLAASEEVGAKLDHLRGLGVTLSVDDFGTGYASLSYLKALPVDVLKIDRSFISGMHDNPDDATLVEAIIAMGHSMRLSVVAEGIETGAQLERLIAQGCNVGQGYHFSPPLNAQRFREFVEARAELQPYSPVPAFAGRASHAPAGIRVLFADDGELMRLVFSDYLDGTGCVLSLAADGVEAVEMVRSATTPFDLIVLDIQMPGMDGLEAARTIRAHEGEKGLGRAPMMALTVESSDAVRWRAKDAGFDRFLTKPVSRAELLEAMAVMLPSEQTDSSDAGAPLEGFSIPAGLEHLLPSFIKEMQRDQLALEALSNLDDRDAFAHHVHAMRGKCAMFGEGVLEPLLGRLEALSPAGGADEILALVAKVVERIGRL